LAPIFVLLLYLPFTGDACISHRGLPTEQLFVLLIFRLHNYLVFPKGYFDYILYYIYIFISGWH